jgi:lipopolysaccharide transport system ATP-binding protein
VAIAVEQLSKRYWLQGSAPSTFQQAAGQVFGALRRRTPFWALRDVSFTIAPGEAVGLIGHNGAGKSTLLRLICGLGRATRGRVAINGRVAALLELGAGFHHMLTGRENLMASAVVSGLRRAEALERFDDIVHFAEIEDFIDQPLRTYSSGMQMRLAFSAAIHVDPDVLIIDEVLAVGDAHFQRKCIERIEDFRQQGKTLLIVSHDLSLVDRFCQRALLMDHGCLKADGPVDDVVRLYAARDRAPVLAGV